MKASKNLFSLQKTRQSNHFPMQFQSTLANVKTLKRQGTIYNKSFVALFIYQLSFQYVLMFEIKSNIKSLYTKLTKKNNDCEKNY